MIRTAVIGHRGTGKSSFLSRVQNYYQSANRPLLAFDLDREIEARTGKKVSDIFANEGESAFREIEHKTFLAIDAETSNSIKDVFLIMGGGFDPARIPSSWRALWLRRSTDDAGRVFLDRPRLEQEGSALQESLLRYQARHPRFVARADETLWSDEGLEGWDEAERDLVLGQITNLQGTLTLLPAQVQSHDQFRSWAKARVAWGVARFELRDDLLSEEQIDLALAELPKEKILLSFRDPERGAASEACVRKWNLACDWPLEQGPCAFAEPGVLSLHERRSDSLEGLREALARFSEPSLNKLNSRPLLKAALPVNSFEELAVGHAWWLEDPYTRVFLPLSFDGRWEWYRLRQGTKVALNFIREGDGSGADQPTLLRWLRRRKFEQAGKSEFFAAVLGDPVVHSRTPMEQGSFAASVFSIRVRPHEWEQGAISFLQTLGLRWAAVTAPLKENAYRLCARRESVGERLQAINTLAWDSALAAWHGTNTDLEGLSLALQSVGSNEAPSEALGDVAVWGGGGTLNVVRSVLPAAQMFALRTGENRDPSGPRAQDYHPQTVIWAVGRSVGSSNEPLHLPPRNWRPQFVIDLNYADDSPGREFVLERGAHYISGLAMFRAQAKAQQEFWRKFQ